MKNFLDDIELISAQAGRRHQVAVSSFLNQSNIAMTGHLALTRAGANELKGQLSSIGWSHIESEESIIGDAIRDIASEARTSALSHLGILDTQNLKEPISELEESSREASENYLLGEVVSQVNRDVNQVIKDYRNASLRAAMLVDLEDITPGDAKLNVMIDEINAKRKLWFRDRAGRKLPSQKYISRLWRQVIRDQWITSYLTTLSEHGETEAVIWHEDPNHRLYGEVLTLSEQDYGLSDIERAFHPNSRALPVAKKYMEKIQ